MSSRKAKTEEGPGAARRRLSVVVVDPLHVVRAGIGLLIDSQPDMAVVVEASAGDEALEKIKGLPRRRMLVLIGLGLDGERDAFWLIRALRERFPQLAIVGCGANAEPMAISRALFVGADGFVDKTANPDEFIQALRGAAAGELVLAGPPSEWIGSIADRIEIERDIEPVLTVREREVLAVAAEGLTARQIATRLGVAERTVTTHLGRIYGKLGVGGRVAAIRSAARSGLVTVGTSE